jgi:two-component system KDP operon response regulator KdpE
MLRDRILVVDDEPQHRRLVRYNLESVGYQVSCVSTGEEAIKSVSLEAPDLIMLDLRLPGRNGYQVCEQIREFSYVPIIMLTALSKEQDMVDGFGAGADDYVTKPFLAKELLARVAAVLRRSRVPDLRGDKSTVECGDLSIDLASRRVFVKGDEVGLSPTEYRLLNCLAVNVGRVMTHEELLAKVWGADYGGQYEGLRLYVTRLRRKIEGNPREPLHLLTRPGIGYMLVGAST